MGLSRNVLMRILWPERGSLFAIVGGAIGLSGDITSFFSEFLSPYYLLALFGIVAGVMALLCLQRASLAEKSNSEKIDDVIHCSVCDAMRFSLFSFGAFILLLLVGQGQTATETIGEKLGLIHADVKVIQQDVSTIREEVGTVSENVDDIHAVIASQKIIEYPSAGEQYFANAWTYTYGQRNVAKAYEALDDLYKKFSPNKMDAAELYYNSARPNFSRDELIQKLVDQAQSSNDATLIVIAARYAADEDESDKLYLDAQNMNPELPFAYWDMQRSSSKTMSNIEPEVRKEILEKQIAGIEKFIELIAASAPSEYFYLPQYQPDHEMLARQNLTSLKTMLDTVNKTIELKNTKRR